MAWMVCEEILTNLTASEVQVSNNTPHNLTDSFRTGPEYSITSNDVTVGKDDITYELIILHVVIPVLCVFGLVGNLLALVVLMHRINEGIEMLERGSLIGMIGEY